MDPLFLWFTTQALGPHLVGKAWDLISHPADRRWRTELAKAAASAADVNRTWRPVRRWLSDPKTWPDLVEPTPGGGERLVIGLTQELRPRGLARKGLTPEARRALAEKLVGEVGARFLSTIDTSLGVAVAHHREMRMLTALADQTTELLALARTRTDAPQRLTQVPPGVAAHVEALLQMDESIGLHLLDALTQPVAHPGRIVPELLVEPPGWIKRMAPRGWVAMAEFASAFDEDATASDLYERAAELGGPDRPSLLAHAARAAVAAGEGGRANELLARAHAIAHGPHAFLAAAKAAVENDPQGVLDAADGTDLRESIDLAVLVAQAHMAVEDHNTAIRVLRGLCANHPRLSGIRQVLSECLFQRAAEASGVLRRSDLEEAFALAVEVRDLRRPWRGDSATAVAAGCGVAGTLERFDRVLQLGLEAPAGEATTDEASDPRVLALVALAGTVTGDAATARAAIARISDPFMKAVTEADLAAKTGDTDRAQSLYREAWDVAQADNESRQAQVGLAELGVWPLPGHADLAASTDGRGAWILAIAEATRGELAAAAQRVSPWRNRYLPCARLLADIRRRQGDVDGAVRVLREAASTHRTAEPLITAAQILTNARRFADAEHVVNEAMPEVTAPDQRRPLLEVLLAAAQDRHDWVQMERYSHLLLGLDPLDADARWFVVGALYNQRRFEEAWHHANQDSPLDPTTDEQTIVWMDLRRRFDPSVAAWRQFLELRRTYPDSEDVHAAVIIAVSMMNVEEAPPTDLLEEWNRIRDDFFVRYPDSNRVWQINIGSSPEEMVDALRPMLRVQAEQYEELRRDVSSGRVPYGMLALLTRRPYALALVATAAGCHVTYPAHPAIAEDEAAVATEALGTTVVAESSVLHLLTHIPDMADVVLSRFDSVVLTDAAYDDLRLTTDDLRQTRDATISWDLQEDLPLLRENEAEQQQNPLNRILLMIQYAERCSRVNHPRLVTFDNLEAPTDHLLPWLGALDHARQTSKTLYSDDSTLRAMARAEGTPAFGTLALLQALKDAGTLEGDDLDHLHLVLRRHGFVDLPPNSEHIQRLGDEAGWSAPSAASFAFSRPSFWASSPEVVPLLGAALGEANRTAPDTMPAWLFAGIYGAGAGQPPVVGTRRAALLLLRALTFVGTDPGAFSRLATAARSACDLLGAPDPVPFALRWLFANLSQDADPQTAAATVLHLVGDLDEATRSVAREIAFGTSG